MDGTGGLGLLLDAIRFYTCSDIAWWSQGSRNGRGTLKTL